jgi:type II secretory pathway component PulM
MDFLQPLKEAISSRTHKELLMWIYGYLSGIILLIVVYMFFHIRSIHEIRAQYDSINKARKRVQIVLSEYQAVKEQRQQVDEIVKKDKNFYLKKYYQDVIASVGISAAGEATIVDQKLENGYSQELLQARFSAITTQQLVEFLQKIEESTRVYVKSVEITKGMQPNTIAVALVLATIKPKEEKSS